MSSFAKVLVRAGKSLGLITAQLLFPGVANLFLKEWQKGLAFVFIWLALWFIFLEYGGPVMRAAINIFAVISVIQLLLSNRFWE